MAKEAREQHWLLYAHNELAVPALAEIAEACARESAVVIRSATQRRDVLLPPPLAACQISIGEAGRHSWDVVFGADNQRGERVPPGFRVRLPHGSAHGMHGYGVHSLSRCDLYVATSEAHRAFLERHRGQVGAATEIVVAGNPRLDRLWRGRRTRGDVLAELGLDPARPTVTIASHWTPGGNLRRYGPALARSVLSALPDANVLQTGHPNLWQRVRYDIEDPRLGLVGRGVRWLGRVLSPFDYDALFAGLAELRREFDRFRLVEPTRTFDVLSAADVLVSDISSATVEFTLFDRPIVLPEVVAANPWDLALEEAYRDASHGFASLDEVGSAIRLALEQPEKLRPERLALRDLCISNLGVAAQRVVSRLMARASRARASRAPAAE